MGMRVKDLGRAAMLVLGVGGALALGGCASTVASDPQGDQQTRVQTARQLCTDLGYAAGTKEFAQCAQAEYDRAATAAAAQSTQVEDGLVNWLRKPAVCSQRACSGR